MEQRNVRAALPENRSTAVLWEATSHPGLVRECNEDAFKLVARACPSATVYLACVADGLGGHAGGEVASRLAVDVLGGEFNSWNGRRPAGFLSSAVKRANLAVFEQASLSEAPGMQTTLTAVVISGDRLAAAYVGDCRLYRMRAGEVEQLSRDHSMANEMLRLRMISKEQAAEHPGRHQLTRSVGGSPFLRVDIFQDSIIQGDRYLICSDGLWGVCHAEELADAVFDLPPGPACEKLVKLALSRGGPDNITAAAISITDVYHRAEPPSWRGSYLSSPRPTLKVGLLHP